MNYIQAQDAFESGKLVYNKRQLPYRFLLPENYSPEQSYPLLIFLHGAGERGSDNSLQLVHGSEYFLAPEIRSQFPAIVVFPQCPEEGYWASIKSRSGSNKFEYFRRPRSNPYLRGVEKLIKDFQKNYTIDTDRIYVGGLSMGGMGTYELVYRNPRKFAAAFAICGGAHPKTAKRLRRPAWRIDHGYMDDVVPLILSERMVDALKQNQANVQWNIHKGVGHDSWDQVFSDSSWLPWLFSHSLKTP